MDINILNRSALVKSRYRRTYKLNQALKNIVAHSLQLENKHRSTIFLALYIRKKRELKIFNSQLSKQDSLKQ